MSIIAKYRAPTLSVLTAMMLAMIHTTNGPITWNARSRVLSLCQPLSVIQMMPKRYGGAVIASVVVRLNPRVLLCQQQGDATAYWTTRGKKFVTALATQAKVRARHTSQALGSVSACFVACQTESSAELSFMPRSRASRWRR